MIEYLKKYNLEGFSINIPSDFLLQLNKIQVIMLNNFNKFIKKKIYFTDNFSTITDADWTKINKTIEEKINEWFTNFPIKKYIQ